MKQLNAYLGYALIGLGIVNHIDGVGILAGTLLILFYHNVNINHFYKNKS